MVANKKPLTLNDPRLDKIKKHRLPVFRINDRIRVFTWENMPRHKMPFATVDITRFHNKTASEIALGLNRLLARGGEIPESIFHLGKKKPEVKPEIVIDESPKYMRYEEVEEWEKASRAQPILNSGELDELLGLE